MAWRIRFDFYGEAQVDRTLERFHPPDDSRPLWEALGDRFLHLERRQFATEGRHASGGWAPLSARYAAWKQRHYPGKPILRRTDALFESLVQGPAIRIIEPAFAEFGSDVDYGRHHQAPTVPGRPPRRRPVEFPEAERREWVKAAQRFVVTGQVPSVGPRGGLSWRTP